MKCWMDVMRQVEPLLDGYPGVFDAWQEGGVEGVVLGPLLFYGGRLPHEPEARIYRQVGCEPPTFLVEPDLEKRRRLEAMLCGAADRGLEVWVFEPGYYARPAPGGHWTDPDCSDAYAARAADTMRHYPMVSGAVLDGPEWGYEICPHLMGYHSFLFNDLPASVAPRCEALGFDYQQLVAARDRLYRRMHELPRERREWSHEGTPFGCPELFGDIEGLCDWLAFRARSLEDVAARRKATLRALCDRPFRLAMGLRTPAFAGLTGVDLARWPAIPDVILPKHYFWHRGFDGLYGTVHRYVEVLTAWNPGMSDAAALAIVKAIFGLELPWIRCRDDFGLGFPDEFFERIVAGETRRSLAAVGGDAVRVMPWVDAGRRPHGGDPFTASDLRRVLLASRAAGLERFLYHHHWTLTPSNWSVISALCGKPWRPAYHERRSLPVPDPDSLAMRMGPTNYAGFDPPDRDVL